MSPLNSNLSKEEVLSALDKVVNKLMNLDLQDFDKKSGSNEDSEIKKGVIARDFGIKEWDWPQGVGLYGLLKLSEYKSNSEYDNFFKEWYDNNLAIGLPSRNVNTTVPLLTLCNLLDKFEEDTELFKKYEKLCLDWVDWVMLSLPRTKDEAFQHVTTNVRDRNSVMLNEGQVWIDTLFMIVLFLAKMGVRYKRKDWIAEAEYQFLVHIKYLYEKKSGFFHHGWSFDENSNFGGIYWCRGNSWYILGAMEFISICGDCIGDGARKLTINSYLAQVEALLKCQDESGLWHTVIDDPASYAETSGSASMAAGILKGVRMGILDKSLSEAALKAVAAILGKIDEDGTVLNVSGGTHVGYNAEHYKNIIIAPMAYGQSLTIIALAEALYHL